ncbi:MAG: magnesium transporter, partial [Acidobacteriota bacterium]
RNLTRNPQNARFSKYFLKELSFGIIVGLLSGLVLGLIAYFWLNSSAVALTVGLAMLASLSASAVFALFVPTVLHLLANIDPAVGAGPFTTILQDMISLAIYFLIASAIIL